VAGFGRGRQGWGWGGVVMGVAGVWEEIARWFGPSGPGGSGLMQSCFFFFLIFSFLYFLNLIKYYSRGKSVILDIT
jgi:hypothetical protein